MDIRNLSWNLFSQTWSVDAYLEYKALDDTKKKKESENGQCQYKGDSSQTKQLR